MRVLGLILILLLNSCSSKLKKIPANPQSAKEKFSHIDSNQDLLISQEEYNLYQQVGYDSYGPAIWFLIILGLVFLFSAVLGYFIKGK